MMGTHGRPDAQVGPATRCLGSPPALRAYGVVRAKPSATPSSCGFARWTSVILKGVLGNLQWEKGGLCEDQAGGRRALGDSAPNRLRCQWPQAIGAAGREGQDGCLPHRAAPQRRVRPPVSAVEPMEVSISGGVT